MGLHLVAWDSVNCSQRSEGSLPRFSESPNQHRMVDMTDPHVIQHRLFNFLDGDRDGVISHSDVRGWMIQHNRAGTVTWDDIVGVKFINFGGYREKEHGVLSVDQVWGWLEGMVWGLLQEAFAPQSSHPEWKVIIAWASVLFAVCNDSN